MDICHLVEVSIHLNYSCNINILEIIDCAQDTCFWMYK